jgi:2-keto-4-pentenoate hydratase
MTGAHRNMSDHTDRIAAAAARLREAEETHQPIDPIRADFDHSDIAAAYAIQATNTDVALKSGRVLAGRKIGLTNPAVQAQFGVHQPDFGVLWADRAYADREPIPADHVLQPRIEAEIALVLDRDLDAERPGPADLIRAIGYVVPAIEVVGSRIDGWRIGIVDTIADNASGGGFVIGGPARLLDGLDLGDAFMRMTTRDGTQVSAGSGIDCLGHPLTAALWLARTVANLGVPLRAGDVVLTGALGPIVVAELGEDYTATIFGVGRVTASVCDRE